MGCSQVNYCMQAVVLAYRAQAGLKVGFGRPTDKHLHMPFLVPRSGILFPSQVADGGTVVRDS
jgi:hypothetical protein